MARLFVIGAILAVVVLLFGCLTGQIAAPTFAQAAPVLNNETRRPEPTQTATLVPTQAIDYESTLASADSTKVSAVETANEAGRVNALATLEHERILLEYDKLTLESAHLTSKADEQDFVRQSWTATYAGTSIPLTSTEQVIVNTKIAAYITATEHYPTQIVAVERAKLKQKYGWLENIFYIFAMFGVGVFCIGIVAILAKRSYPVKQEEIEESESEVIEPTETPITIRKENGKGSVTLLNLIVPCSPKQLTELAIVAVNGERAFAINRLESMEGPLKSQRTMLYAFRNFMVKNRFAYSIVKERKDKKEMEEFILTDEGVCFLEGWFENHQLPGEFKFKEETIQGEKV